MEVKLINANHKSPFLGAFMICNLNYWIIMDDPFYSFTKLWADFTTDILPPTEQGQVEWSKSSFFPSISKTEVSCHCTGAGIQDKNSPEEGFSLHCPKVFYIGIRLFVFFCGLKFTFNGHKSLACNGDQ